MGERSAPGARWQELSKSECFALLAQEGLGRVAVVDDQGPVIFPVNFALDRHMVVFRTDEGTKLDAAARGSRVVFEIDGTGTVAHSGWGGGRGVGVRACPRGNADHLPGPVRRKPGPGIHDVVQRPAGPSPLAAGDRGGRNRPAGQPDRLDAG